MKRPKTCCDPARDEYPQLTFFFVKYTESVFKPIRRQTPTLSKNAVHLYLIGSHAKVAEVMNSADYESASNMLSYI